MRWNATVYNSLGLVRDNRVIDPIVKSVDGYLDLPTLFISGSSLNVLGLDVTAPTVPSNLRSTYATSSTISLEWNSAADPVGAPGENVTGVVSHSLYRDGQFRVTIPVPGTSFNDTGLTAETAYNYQVLATDAAGNSSALSSAVNVSTTAVSTLYPTPDEVWANAPPWPTEAQVLSASEWEMNKFNGAMVGKIVHMQPRDEGHADSKSFIDAYNELMSGNTSRGGIIYVHYGTSGIHHIYKATDNNPWWSSNGHLYLIGVPDANGNRPTLYGHNDGNFHPFLFGAQNNSSDIFIKDLIIENTGAAAAMGFGRTPATSGSYTATYVSRPTGQKLVLENFDLRNCPAWGIITSFEWVGRWFDDSLRDLAASEVSTEIWWRNCHMERNHSSHIFYCDRIKKAVILESKFENPAFNAHAFKCEAIEFVVLDNQISNAGLDGEVYTSNAPWGSSLTHQGAVPISLMSGQSGYFCNNIIIHHVPAASALSIAIQNRHAAHCCEIPDPMRGPTGPANTAGDFFDPTFWTERAEYLDVFLYDNTHVKLPLDAAAEALLNNQTIPLIANSNGTWPAMTPLHNTSVQIQCDNPWIQANYGQVYSDTHESGLPLQTENGDVYINVPDEWWERSRVTVAGEVIYGLTQTQFNARGEDVLTGYVESLAQAGVGVNSVNPSCTTNISPRTDGTGPGRFVFNSDPIFGGETYHYDPKPDWYPAIGEVVQIDDGTTLGESIRAQGGLGLSGGTDPDDIVDPWCGGAVLTLYGRPYLVVYGGGHGDSHYNGIHKFGPLDSNSPTWSLFLAPSASADYVDATVYADGRQASNHTYNHLAGVAGTLYCTTTTSAGQSSNHSPSAYKFTAEGKTRVAQEQLANNPRLQNVGCCAAYNGKIYYRGNNSSSDQLHIYDIASDSWASSGDTSTYFAGYPAMAVDTSRGALLIVGKPNSHYYDDVDTLVRRTGLPVPPDWNSRAPDPVYDRCVAVEYDAGRDTFVSMYINNVVYELDAATLATGGTPSWTQRTFTGVDWGTCSPAGVYGRFRYIPSLKGFVIFPGPGPDGGVYFARST